MCFCNSGLTLQPDGRTCSESGNYFGDCAVVNVSTVCPISRNKLLFIFLCNQAVGLLFTLSKLDRSVTIFFRSVFMLQKGFIL